MPTRKTARRKSRSGGGFDRQSTGDPGRAVSRFLSAHPVPNERVGERIICLSSQYPGFTPPLPEQPGGTQRTRQPTDRFGKGGDGASRSAIPYLALHLMGFSVPPRLRLERWALAPPFHPYPALPEPAAHPKQPWNVSHGCGHHLASGFRKGWAVYFLWHFPSAKPFGLTSRVYPEAGPLSRTSPGYAASRPAVFGLSSPSLRRERSSALPEPPPL